MEKDNNKPSHVTNNYFYAPIGQHIDHIENQYVSFDEDMKMQIGEVQNQHATPPSDESKPTYTRHIETTSSITAIGNLFVNEANQAKTKAAFISKLKEINIRTRLFTFKPSATNAEKAECTNAILAAYGYKGDKCANITDDDFQRNF